MASIAGCASHRPVLYPNVKYKRVGEAATREDIDDCMRLADHAGIARGEGSQVIESGVEGAATGFVTCAVAAAIVGGNVFSAAVIDPGLVTRDAIAQPEAHRPVPELIGTYSQLLRTTTERIEG